MARQTSRMSSHVLSRVYPSEIKAPHLWAEWREYSQRSSDWIMSIFLRRINGMGGLAYTDWIMSLVAPQTTPDCGSSDPFFPCLHDGAGVQSLQARHEYIFSLPQLPGQKLVPDVF